jgi:hypothetical protein
MPKYRVQLDAQNLLVEMEGALAEYGFITWRTVNAADATAAESAAVELLRCDAELREMLQNESDDPPIMDVIEIVEVDLRNETPATGRI